MLIRGSERKLSLTDDTISHVLDRDDRKRVAVELNDVMIADQGRDGQQSLPRAAAWTGGAAILGKLEQRQAGNMVSQPGMIARRQARIIQHIYGAGSYLP